MSNFSTDSSACDVYNCKNTERTHNIDAVQDPEGTIIGWICDPCGDLITRVIKSMLKGAK